MINCFSNMKLQYFPQNVDGKFLISGRFFKVKTEKDKQLILNQLGLSPKMELKNDILRKKHTSIPY